MAKEETYCYCYFAICSKGEIHDMVGFVADENSDFDPGYITNLLQIEPFDAKRMGTPRKNGVGFFPFSDWGACRQESPEIDAETQCLAIVRMLHGKIPELLQIKEQFNVDFSIIVVPHIYHEQSPILGFPSEIIEFCHATGTEIVIDQYVYDREPWLRRVINFFSRSKSR